MGFSKQVTYQIHCIVQVYCKRDANSLPIASKYLHFPLVHCKRDTNSLAIAKYIYNTCTIIANVTQIPLLLVRIILPCSIYIYTFSRFLLAQVCMVGLTGHQQFSNECNVSIVPYKGMIRIK